MNLRLRSALFTPATRPERFAKADEVGADLLIIDLEDSVAPRDKATARATAMGALARPAEAPILRGVRINALRTRNGLGDLLALLQSQARPDVVVLPKVEAAAQLHLLDDLLREARFESRLIALVESARGLQALTKIAHATPRLAALMLGAADLAADLGCGQQAPNLRAARAALVSACASADIAALDSPYFDLHNDLGLRQDTRQAADMGFTGKAAIHPSQIAAIRETFTPTREAVAHARAVLAENERGVGQVDGQMVDEAVARQARRVLTASTDLPIIQPASR
jgi:(S)-citramalyl-CoA lyase